MNIIKDDQPGVEVFPDDTGIDVHEYLSDEIYEALIDPEVVEQVNIDATSLTRTIIGSDLTRPIKIRLDKVARDYRSICRYEVMGSQIFIPGLIGLESLDYASPEVDDKRPLVRLYSGLMVAEELTKTKLNQEAFFHLSFTKQFAIDRMRPVGQVDEFSENKDPQVIERHRRRTIARFASGIVMEKLFPEEAEAQAVQDVLIQQYANALSEDELNYVVTSVIIPDDRNLADSFPSEEHGYIAPLDFQVINTVLRGRISR